MCYPAGAGCHLSRAEDSWTAPKIVERGAFGKILTTRRYLWFYSYITHVQLTGKMKMLEDFTIFPILISRVGSGRLALGRCAALHSGGQFYLS